jgi:Cu/Ag efflux pump CusA
MIQQKISKSLQQYLLKTRPSTVEVVVELHTISSHQYPFLSKQEKIKSIKQSFNEDLEIINHVLQDNGGKIIDTAWINKTVKIMIPVQGLDELANIQSVEIIDLPHQLK